MCLCNWEVVTNTVQRLKKHTVKHPVIMASNDNLSRWLVHDGMIENKYQFPDFHGNWLKNIPFAEVIS
jgi:hypothetical protein